MPKRKQPEQRLIDAIVALAIEVQKGGDTNDQSGHIDYLDVARRLTIAAAHLEYVK